MDEQHISQAEIDALINGVAKASEPAAETALGKDDLAWLRDPLGSFVFQAVPALTDLMGVQSEGGIADIYLATLKEISNLGAPQVLVGRAYLNGRLKGSAYYMIPMPFARMILKEMLREELPAELDEATLDRMATELTKMNKAGLAELSSYLSAEVTADPVAVSQAPNLAAAATEPPDTQALVVGVDMAVGDAMGRMLMVWPQAVAEPLAQVARTKQPKAAPKAPPAAVVPPQATPVSPPPVVSAGPVVQPAVFPSLAAAVAAVGPRNMELLMDVRLMITVELGRTRRHIKEVLSLGPGSVLELDRLANEQVDMLVNGKLVAKAEVVVVDENYGARVTQIVSPEDRVQAMR